jgi:hypothetical protein
MRLCIAGLFTAFYLAVAPISAGAADFVRSATTYAGTIGKSLIIAELIDAGEDGSMFGRYAYMSRGVDIPLHGEKTHGTIKLGEEKPCTDDLCPSDENGKYGNNGPIGARWVLKSSADGEELTGTWRDGKTGKALPIKLERRGTRTPWRDFMAEDLLLHYDFSEPDRNPAPTLKALPYDFLRMEYPRKEGDVVSVGGSEYRMDTDERTGFYYPRVTRLDGGDAVVLNIWLNAQRVQWSMNAYECLSSVYLNFHWRDMDYNGTTGFKDGHGRVTVDLLTSRLMVLTESGSDTCDTFTEDFIVHRMVDVRTGQTLPTRFMVRGWEPHDGFYHTKLDPANLPKEGTIHWWPDDTLRKYALDNVNKSAARLHALYPGCDLQQMVATNLDVYFKNDSLVLALSGLKEDEAVCNGDLVEIPLNQARPLLTDEGARYFAEFDGKAQQ